MNVILIAAWALALISAFFVPPDTAYFDYIDFRTLGLLFCLMTVMAGLNRLGLFARAARRMLQSVRDSRSLELILVFLCFVSSMFITNDVALITFVPFALQVLKLAGLERRLIPVVVMQTVAANLGSMLTPVGNPQNLYLYSTSGMGVGQFLGLMLPYTLLSAVLIFLFTAVQKKMPLEMLPVKGEQPLEPFPAQGEQPLEPFPAQGEQPLEVLPMQNEQPLGSPWKAAVYGVLFLLCLGCVVRLIPVWVMVPLIFSVVLIMDRKTLKHVDYSLLLTFVGFFIFIGNMGRVEVFHSFLKRVIGGHEILTAALSSQVLSNVPAALLLSGFTEEWEALILGTNIGGLGTLIASMASLISYRCVAAAYPEKRGRYLGYFTGVNAAFLLVLLGAALAL